MDDILDQEIEEIEEDLPRFELSFLGAIGLLMLGLAYFRLFFGDGNQIMMITGTILFLFSIRAKMLVWGIGVIVLMISQLRFLQWPLASILALFASAGAIYFTHQRYLGKGHRSRERIFLFIAFSLLIAVQAFIRITPMTPAADHILGVVRLSTLAMLVVVAAYTYRFVKKAFKKAEDYWKLVIAITMLIHFVYTIELKATEFLNPSTIAFGSFYFSWLIYTMIRNLSFK